MKNSVWYFAFEKRKLVLKKYPAKKSNAKKLKIRKSSALAQPPKIKKTKRKKKK